ncbi:pyrimidine reductase [Catellatospora methionotrophica]|uniref:Pyrimidine reductase n=1 Tax=Catellatospora methionotrophica TaxID=121620 RepID=A0A8J3LED0_9ACTN|nr:dihydrofolate reductase family protein [Catellatospora methionotrophica]GIG16753.1 pyrimidine reductase [Catellatospora methionotrophica]
MRKIVASYFISVDGVVESPQSWHFPYFNSEMGAAVGTQMAESDALLLGRRTYEEFAAHWSTQGSDVEFADQINGTTKYVVSRTLSSADWRNTTLPGADPVGQIRQLREQPGKNISVTGSPTLARWLLANDLLDEISLLIHPIVVGKGQRLFDGDQQQSLALVHSATFSTGVVHATYRTV